MDQFTGWLHQISQPKTLLLVSGGSSGKAFAQAWKTLDKSQQANLTISLADERYAEFGHANSNWLLLQALGVDLSDPRHFQILHNGDTMKDTTDRWEKLLSKAIDDAENIVAIFGVGTDHHIAGIKPQSPAIAETERLTACYAWEDYNRITISPRAFELIDDAVLFATGADKYSAITSIEGELDYREYPSQLIKRCDSFTVYYEA